MRDRSPFCAACDAARAPDSPIDLCQRCLRAAYQFVQDGLPAACALCEEPIPHAVPRLCSGCQTAVHLYVSIQLQQTEARDESSDRPPAVGHVYYARRGALVKIGFTTDLRQRMRTILPDEVLAVEPGSYATEAARHRQFEHLRHAGQREWFRQARDLAAHIQRVVAQCGPPPELPTLSQMHAGKPPPTPPQEWPPGWIA